MDIAAFVDAADIARLPVAVQEGLRVRLRVVPVAGHHHRAGDPQFAGFAARHLVAFRVHHQDVGAGQRLADRRRVFRGMAQRHQGGGGCRLGGAVGVHQFEVRQDLRQPCNSGFRHRRAAERADPPLRQVEALELRVQQAEVVHRRHQDADGHPHLRCQFQEGAGLERLHHHGMAADIDHVDQDRDQTGDMAGGHRQDRHVAGAGLPGMGEMHRRGDDAEMGQHRALRLACGAGGVEQGRRVVLVDGDRRRRRRIAQQGGIAVAVQGIDQAQVGQRLQVRQVRFHVGLVDQRRGAALLQLERRFRGAVADVHRHGDRAQPVAGEAERQELDAVADQQGEAVALLQAGGGQAAGQGIDHRIQGTKGQGAGDLVGDRRLVGRAGGGGPQHRIQVRRPVAIGAHHAAAVMRLVTHCPSLVRGPVHACLLPPFAVARLRRAADSSNAPGRFQEPRSQGPRAADA